MGGGRLKNCQPMNGSGWAAEGGGGVTSVLGEENGKRAFLQEACWVVLLSELVYLPVVNAVVIPGLLFLILHPRARTQDLKGSLSACTLATGYLKRVFEDFALYLLLVPSF